MAELAEWIRLGQSRLWAGLVPLVSGITNFRQESAKDHHRNARSGSDHQRVSWPVLSAVAEWHSKNHLPVYIIFQIFLEPNSVCVLLGVVRRGGKFYKWDLADACPTGRPLKMSGVWVVPEAHSLSMYTAEKHLCRHPAHRKRD